MTQSTDHGAYVQDMFGRIAARYDLMNRLMTFNQDRAWRRFVVSKAAPPPGGWLLDIATGTGDIAFEARRQVRDLHVVAADFALPMMRVGQQRPGADAVAWQAADTLRLPYADNSFDAVTSGYLFRNVTDIPGALAEQMRVLKPGGRLVTLDTTPPPHNLLRPFIQFHLKVVIPTLGRIISGEADAYKYLPESTLGFKTAEELAALMRAAELQDVGYQRFMFGTMAVHWGTTPKL
ncbi:ubiquinone/menaquinone biosynthesis methyltransferase [Aggregatilinea lenta]|uniref:ubiquinone/menaquinone biosynthesis methyltransferase n=1 Tax=Aggregatilinea lenta TaxID=913108 RepID=UPI000E5C279D|nr:ubiquinone/menaquinone biosynthesis methyltransferase [Aggregatilinea lenta]